MATSVGWDLGGVNLKLAKAVDGRVTSVVQVPCPALPNPEKFDRALKDALASIDPNAAHAVTMTGELSDVFASRREGVSYLVALMRKSIGETTRFFGLDGFHDADRAIADWQKVASANWMATAAFVANHAADGLLVDAGTTTTDLIPLKAGTPRALGRSDGERLTEGELVYRGVVRTPVMAVVTQAPFKGRMQNIAAERFATMADVYRLLGELPENADPFPTADGRGASLDESAARLARMLGRDAIEADFLAWRAFAYYIARHQLDAFETTTQLLIEREALPSDAPVIGAGCGRFLAEALATRLKRPYLDFADLIDCADEARDMAGVCAPAVAVSLLNEASRDQV